MSSALLSLPNEILLQIVNDIDDVPCYTMESVSQSCKTLHTLASERLHQHLKRKRDYSSIAIGYFDISTEVPHAKIVHPIVPLKAFLADPDGALYVKTLEVGSFKRSDRPNSHELTCELEDKLVSMTLDIRQCLYLESYRGFRLSSSRWSRALLSNDPDAAAALLITMVPNLCKLRCSDPSRYSGTLFFSPILDMLLQRASNEVHESGSLNSFHNLCEVELRGEGYWWNSRGTSCWSKFGAIPSLQKVKARLVGPGLRDNTSAMANPIAKSNVISLEFDESLLNAANLEPWLYDIKALQVFRLRVHAGSREVSAACLPGPIVKTLHLHTFRSLTSLELTGFADLDVSKCQHAELFIGSLCAFKVLSHIRVESIVFCRTINRQGAPLRERSPKYVTDSLKRIDSEDTAAARPKFPADYQCLMDILPASAKRLRLIGNLSTDDASKLLSKSTSTTLLPAERCQPSLVTVFLEDCEPFREFKRKQAGFILEFGKCRALEHKASPYRVMTDVVGRIAKLYQASTGRMEVASRPLLSDRALYPTGKKLVATHQHIANK